MSSCVSSAAAWATSHEQESDSMDINNGCHDVILDHCSATWSVDECLSTAGNDQNLTIQWCLIAEGLNHSIHAKGDHGYGSLARANGAGVVAAQFVGAQQPRGIRGWAIITAGMGRTRSLMCGTT